jgi:hypothetical protein
MSDPEEQARIDANLDIIRAYLKENFPAFIIDEKSNLSLSYTFTVANIELHKSYKLRIDGPRLLDRNNTSAKTQAELKSHDIARKMVEADGDFFYWG